MTVRSPLPSRICLPAAGSHIKGLFINLIHRFWPDLLKADNFLVRSPSKHCRPAYIQQEEFVTPIVKVGRSSGKDKLVVGQGATGADGRLEFFTIPEYEAWRKVPRSPAL
jgi:DNA topoisomerase-2